MKGKTLRRGNILVWTGDAQLSLLDRPARFLHRVYCDNRDCIFRSDYSFFTPEKLSSAFVDKLVAGYYSLCATLGADKASCGYRLGGRETPK